MGIIPNGGPPRKEHWGKLTCSEHVQFESVWNIRGYSIYHPLGYHYFGKLHTSPMPSVLPGVYSVFIYIYRIHKLPYLEEKIPYKTRTTRLYSLLFFRNKNLIQDDFPNGDWWPDFSWLKGLPNVSWLHNQWQPSLLATETTCDNKVPKRTDFGGPSDTSDGCPGKWMDQRLGFPWIFYPKGIPHLEVGSKPSFTNHWS